jgi:hypothetical protein
MKGIRMRVYKKPDGSLIVPKRAEGNGVVGDGQEVLRPGSADYEKWNAWITRHPEDVTQLRDDDRKEF